MRRALILAAVAVFVGSAADAQTVEIPRLPISPLLPPPMPLPPAPLPPMPQPLPLAPTPVPLPPPVAAPVQVVPPAPPPEKTELPDGSETCACYQTVEEPVYQNGVQIGTRPVRRLTGQSSEQCCPAQ